MTIQLPTLESSGLTASVTVANRTMSVSLVGNADMQTRTALSAFLVEMHLEAERRSMKEVRVEMRELEFMNSSCFKDFVSWISRVQQAADNRRYRITLVSDPQRHWQKRSLHALSCFASDIVTVQS